MDIDLHGHFADLPDHDPSEEFVQDFRAELLAEARFIDLVEDFEPLEGASAILTKTGVEAVDVDFGSGSMNGEVRPLAAIGRWLAVVATAALVVLGGVWFAAEGSTTGPLETAADVEPVLPFVRGTPSNLQPGRYRVETLGAEFSFEISKGTPVLRNSEGVFELGAPTESRAARVDDARSISIFRLSELIETGDQQALSESPPSATDVFAWLEERSDDLESTILAPADLGGLRATRFLLFGDSDQCADSSTTVCAEIFRDSFGNVHSLHSGEAFGVWFVNNGQFEPDAADPLVVVIAADLDESIEWFMAADRLLSTVQFAEATGE